MGRSTWPKARCVPRRRFDFILNISAHTPLAASDCTRWLTKGPVRPSCSQAALTEMADALAFTVFVSALTDPLQADSWVTIISPAPIGLSLHCGGEACYGC